VDLYFTIVLSQLHLYPAYQRFTLFLLPFVLIIISMTFNVIIDKRNAQSRIVLLLICAALIPTSITTKGSDSRELTQYFLEKIKPADFIVIDNLALPDFLYYTYNTKMTNKIVVPFDKVNGRILYRSGSFFEFPKFQQFWFYSTRTKDFDKLIKKENGFETINGYKIIDKMITSNGAVLKVSKY